MDGINREWDRRQWVGEGQGSALRPSEAPVVEQWHFSQWAGTPRVLGDRAQPLPTQGTRSGFSGFGHSDSGGQRWAEGYRSSVPKPITAPAAASARAR